MRKGRVEWVDTAKGIGITLVVLGHNKGLTSFMYNYIYSFHMPLFFFLAGYVVPFKQQEGFYSSIRRRVRTLLVPYFVFSAILYAYWYFLGRRFGGKALMSVSPLEPLIGTFISTSDRNWMLHNLPLWFLTCLFVVEILFYLLIRWQKGHYGLALALFGCSVVGYLSSVFQTVRLPWSIDTAITAVVFFGTGFLVSENRLVERITPNLKVTLLSAALLAGAFISRVNKIDMASNRYYPIDFPNNLVIEYFYFYIAAWAGIFAAIKISQAVRLKVLKYLGRNALHIMALHPMLLSVLKGVTVFVMGVPLEITQHSPAWAFVYTGLTLLISMPIIYLINRYAPFMVGRPKAYTGKVLKNGV